MKIKGSLLVVILALSMLALPAAGQGKRVARWEKGSPDSEQFQRDGFVVKQVKAQGVTVTAQVADTSNGFVVQVEVSNDGQGAIEVRPEQVAVEVTQPQSRVLAHVPAEKVALGIRGMASTRAASEEMSGMMATKTVVTTETKYVDKITYGPNGHEVRSEPVTTTNVSHVPDEDARSRAQWEATRIRNEGDAWARAVLRDSLKPRALQQGASVKGSVYFRRDSDAQDVLVRVPLGDLTVEVPFKAVRKNRFLGFKEIRFE